MLPAVGVPGQQALLLSLLPAARGVIDLVCRASASLR